MKIQRPTVSMLAGVGLLSCGMAAATTGAPRSSKPTYAHFTYFWRRGDSRLCPRPDLLEARIKVDLRDVPLRECLQRIFAQAHQEYAADPNLTQERRISLQGDGLPLFEVLDQLVHQVGGGWTQEMRNGRPVIRIGAGLSLIAIHIGPGAPTFSDQVAACIRANPRS